jgi:protoporphyrinogen oxidase
MRVVVIGCGPAGLGAAYALQEAQADFVTLESSTCPGGLAVTDRVGGFLFDRTGHFLHTRSDRFRGVLAASGVPLETIARRSCIAIHDRVVPFPLQYNLWAFPETVRQRVLHEIDARPASVASGGSLAQGLLSSWGPTLLREFFQPYNEKMFGTSLDQVPADCLGRFVPSLDRSMMQRGCEGQSDGLGYNPTFLYPESGAVGDLFAAIAAPVSPRIRLGERVQAIDLRAKRCHTQHGPHPFDRLITTLPLNRLLPLCNLSVPKEVSLDHADTLNVRIGFRGRMRRDDHWVYVPDRALPFYRIGFPLNVNRKTCPVGSASLSVECGLRGGSNSIPDTALIAESAINFVHRHGFAEVNGVVTIDTCVISPAYVLHRSTSRVAFEALFNELAAQGVYPCGRYGRWEYFSMEDAFLDGERAARAAIGEPT